MSPRSHLDEYLLNDVGKVYQGSYKTPIGRDWAFAQFEGGRHVLYFFAFYWKSVILPNERKPT